MITGDKRETAKQIAFNSGIFKKDTTEIRQIYGKNQQIETLLNQLIFSEENDFALMINGDSLPFLIDEETYEENVIKVFEKARSVVVYRASPSQKAEIIKFVMAKVPDSRILAVGDGANDVNMI